MKSQFEQFDMTWEDVKRMDKLRRDMDDKAHKYAVCRSKENLSAYQEARAAWKKDQELSGCFARTNQWFNRY